MRATMFRRDVDDAYRNYLLNRCPEAVRPMMREGLTNGPNPNGARHSIQYFGKDLTGILMRVGPLLDRLELEVISGSLKGWLDGTGFSNDYRIIKAFAKWAELETVAPIMLAEGITIIEPPKGH